MYQHQRQQQKIKIQEKEAQLQQLAKDRAELSSKLATLQTMVTSLFETASPITVGLSPKCIGSMAKTHHFCSP